MAVLIKGMEMPISCEDCPMGFSVNFGILCTPTHNIVGDGEISKKQGFCPLVPVPPHGRLIDADAFDERVRIAGGMADEELSDDFKDGIQTTLLMLKTQRTIIPAEEGET